MTDPKGVFMPLARPLMFGLALVLAVSLAFSQAKPKPAAPTEAKAVTVENRYYIIHADLSPDDLREVSVRLDRMAEEYIQRTKGFPGKVTRKFPFFIYSDPKDYVAAGGFPGSAGCFTGDKLMAIAAKDDAVTWHVIQHEGFHQFVANTMGRNIPIWLNEGMAEYFGEGIFTGDGYEVGLIPPGRLKRVQKEIADGRLKSLSEMLNFSHVEWNAQLGILNYDQAWSMVQFLVHGDDGKYQKPFVSFVNAISRGTPWQKAFSETLSDVKGFEQKWKEYWTGLTGSPTEDQYLRATVATLTSFLARASSQKQAIATFDDFAKAAAAEGGIKSHKDDWLPPDLLTSALRALGGQKSPLVIEEGEGKVPQIVAELADGARVVGAFKLKGNRVDRVFTTVDTTARSIAQAKAMLDDGKKDSAKSVLLKAIREFPKSPKVEEAKTLMGTIK